MATQVEEGYVGNITSDQEKKLQSFWLLLLFACDYETGNLSDTLKSASVQSAGRRFSLLGRTESNMSTSDENMADFKTAISNFLTQLGSSKKEVSKVMIDLNQMPPEDLRRALYIMLKQEHPDSLALRFLRARKWNVSKAFEMFILAITWRHKEIGVDEKVLPYGESHEAERCRSENAAEQKKGDDFMKQFRLGKHFAHGRDALGRPIGMVRVRLHQPGTQSEEQLERFIVHVLETTRLVLIPPVETSTVVFDMTDFSISNFEYPPVKFIVRCFQDNYPESLGVILIHNAPWIFSTFWRVIRGWLDPVVASKIHFTNGPDDLAKFIPQDTLFKELGGSYDYEYEYVEPTTNEDYRLTNKTTRDKLMAERYKLCEELFVTTASWIRISRTNNQEAKAAVEQKRAEHIEALRVNYWKLDPYVRSRSLLDRTGVIIGNGEINFYPHHPEKSKVEGVPAFLSGERDQDDEKENMEGKKEKHDDTTTTNAEKTENENIHVQEETNPTVNILQEKVNEIDHIGKSSNAIATQVAAQ